MSQYVLHRVYALGFRLAILPTESQDEDLGTIDVFPCAIPPENDFLGTRFPCESWWLWLFHAGLTTEMRTVSAPRVLHPAAPQRRASKWFAPDGPRSIPGSANRRCAALSANQASSKLRLDRKPWLASAQYHRAKTPPMLVSAPVECARNLEAGAPSVEFMKEGGDGGCPATGCLWGLSALGRTWRTPRQPAEGPK